MPDHNRILLAVDADPYWRTLAAALAAKDCDVEIVGDPTQTEAALVVRRADLVILDLDLPGRIGWQVAERLNLAHPQLPIVATTSHFGLQLKAAMCGVDVVVEKPLGSEQLVRAVVELLSLAEQTQLGRITATLRLLKENQGNQGVVDAPEVTEVLQSH
jgi:DNA-binding response OmpR family regulator